MITEELLPGLYRFADTCNVYVIDRGEWTVAIDFGSGAWRDTELAQSLPPLGRVYLTHHHPDQCAGLESHAHWPFVIHAPAGDETFLAPDAVPETRAARVGIGIPPTYAVLEYGIPNVRYDMVRFADLRGWHDRRVRFIHTPGHGQNALTVILDHHGKQLAFTGDAVHDGATIHQPYCLEWDHWTGDGALAAWEGIERLLGVKIDLLCPSHGPVIRTGIRRTLRTLSRRLLQFYRAKGAVAAGAPDDYVCSTPTPGGARKVLPNLYQFGANGYMILSTSGEAMVIDAQLIDMTALESLLDELGHPPVTACTATHYHYDHSDAIPVLKEQFGAESWLHPWVAEALANQPTWTVPWLPLTVVKPDHLWPIDGTWTWQEYEFTIAPFPGQTWWHCCFMTTIDGTKTMFAGDNFQPPTRWNGTGGFCAANGCRFAEGFATSAQRVIDWSPDLLANGHDTYTHFRASRFRQIIRWAHTAKSATLALCPSGDLETDYFLHTDKQMNSRYRL